MSHAVLSPSAASRWLECTRSARLEQQFPDSSGVAAAEGTLAHTLSELIIGYKLGRVSKKKYHDELRFIQANELYDNSMYEYCDAFSAYVLEQYHTAQAHTKDALIFLEDRVDLTRWIQEGYGTVDIKIIADRVLDIIDLKYGKGVSVSAEENKQMMLYGLGELEKVDFMYDIETVRMTIYQPRIDNISTFEMSVSALRKWAEDELVPKAKLAFAGKGEFVAGKHCQFCKVRATCKANSAMQLELAKHDFKEATLLTDEEVSDIISRAKGFETWLEAVKSHALQEALKGKKWPGHKLVSGKSSRVYTDEAKIAEVLKAQGYTDARIFTKKLLGITAMEKEITKAAFTTFLSDLVTKPNGAPTLVSDTDKRPAINSVEAAQKDFENVTINN